MVLSIVIASALAAASGATAASATAASAAPGRWTRSATPALDNDAVLSDVSCSSATNCAAVGTEDVHFESTLIEMFDGTDWRRVQAPPGEGDGDFLRSVSCPSSTLCIAVGEVNGDNPLIESWNGTTWSVMQQSLPVAFNLAHVSCVSTTACVVVGSSYAQRGARPMSGMWDGATWSVVPMPSKSPGGPLKFYESHAYGVSCTSMTACKAVGDIVNDHNLQQPLVEKWNGTKWSIKPSADLGGVQAGFSNVSCSRPGRCTIAGSTAGHGNTPLVERGDGGTWTVAQLDDADYAFGMASGVSCLTVTRCAVVGSYVDKSTHRARSLVETLDGSTWSRAGTPGAANVDDELAAVSCPTTDFCVAVGDRASLTGGGTVPIVLTGRP